MIEGTWSMSAVRDFIYPETRGERPADLERARGFHAALTRIAARDPDVHRLMIGVRNLMIPAAALHEPDIARRVQTEMDATGTPCSDH
jgi:hypothetical protein